MRAAIAPSLVLAISIHGFGSPTAAQEEPPEVIRGVSYVGLSVSNLEASVGFYREPGQLKPAGSGRIEPGGAFDAVAGSEVTANWQLLESTNSQLRLLEFARPEGEAPVAAVPVNGPGIMHVCYQADQDNGAYELFLERGAETMGATEMVALNPRNPVLYAYARDPDGAILEIEHIDVERVPIRKPPKGFHRLRHVSLATPDMDRAIAFYSVLLNQPKPRRVGGTDGLTGEQFDKVSGLPGTRILMAWFKVRNLELELSQYLSHPTEAGKPRPLDALGYNLIVFDVASTEGAKKLLESAGGTLVSDAQPMDGGEILFGRDPDGNLLGFLEIDQSSSLSSNRFPTQR